MNRNNQPFDPGWDEGLPMIRGQSRDAWAEWESSQGSQRDPSSGWGSNQGMMRNDPIAPPPPSWGAISRQGQGLGANNWEDEPQGGMMSQFSGRPSGLPPSSIKRGLDEMQRKIQNLQASGFSNPLGGLSLDSMDRHSQMQLMDSEAKSAYGQMESMDMGGRVGMSQMQAMDMGGRPGDNFMRQQRRTPSPPRNNLWNENNSRHERESLRSHPRSMMEPESFRNRQFEQNQSQDIMDEVDVIWESAKSRRQDRRPITPSPPRQRRQSPPRRPLSPPPPHMSRHSRSPSPPPIPQLPDKVYSCICRIVLFEDSCQAGVVELEGSGGKKAYCFFLAKHVVSRSISKLSSQLRTGNIMKVNARLVSALARLPYLASTVWSDQDGGPNLGNLFFDPDEEDLMKYQQLASHLARQLDAQLSSGQIPPRMDRSSRDTGRESRERRGPMSIPYSGAQPVSEYLTPHSLPPPVSIGRAPVLPKPAPAIPRREEERRLRDGYQHGDVWKAIKQGSQRNPPKSRLAEEFFTENQGATPQLTRAQIDDQRRLAEEFKRQEERAARDRKLREDKLMREKERENWKKRKESEKNKPRKFVEHLDDGSVKKGINQIQKKIHDLEARIVPAADKLGISAKEVDKFGYAVRSDISQSKGSSPEVIEIAEGTQSASEVYQSMFASDQQHQPRHLQEKGSERGHRRDKSSERSHRRERSPQREKRSRNRSRSNSPAHKRRTTSPAKKHSPPHRRSSKSSDRDHRSSGVSQIHDAVSQRSRNPRSSRSPTHRRRHRSRSRSPRRSQHRSSKSKEPRSSKSKEPRHSSKSPLRFGRSSRSKSPRSRRHSGRRSSRSRSRNRGENKDPVPAFMQQSGGRRDQSKEDMTKAMKDAIEQIKRMSDTEKDTADRVYVMIEAEMLFDGEFRQLTHIGASASASKRQLSFFRSIIPNYIDEYMSNLVTQSESNFLKALSFKYDEGLKSYKFRHIKKGDIIPHKESEALEDLMSFLRSVSENKKEIILFTHSSEMLLPVLLAKLDYYDLSKEFNELVNAFCDLSSCIGNLKLGEIWKNTKFTDLSDIYKHVMGRSWPRESRHCDGVSVLCGSIVKRMVKDYEDYLSTQNLHLSHSKFLDMCGRQTLKKFKTSNKEDLAKIVCNLDLKRSDISFVEFYPSDRDDVVVVPLKRCDIIEVIDVDDVEEEGIDDEVYFELEALEASVVNETIIKPGHFATVSLLILTKKRSSSSSIFEDHLDGQFVLVAKNNYFKKSHGVGWVDTQMSNKSPSDKCQISRQIVKVLRTLRPCSDSEDMCEAVYIVQIKVLNPSDWEMSLEQGDNIAVYRKERILDKEEQLKRSYAKGDELPCPRTPPVQEKKKKKKKAKQVQPVDFDSLDMDALDFEPSDSEDETSDEEDNSKADPTEGNVDENEDIEKEAVPASYPSEAELFVKMNVKQLKEELSNAGLNIYGLKKDLVGRLFEYKKEMALNPHKNNLKKMTAEKIEAVRREDESPGLRIEALEVAKNLIEDVFNKSTRHPAEKLLDDIIDQAMMQTYGPQLNKNKSSLPVPEPSCTQIDSDDDIIEDSSKTSAKFHEKLYRPFLTETLNIMPKKKAKVRITLTRSKIEIFTPELEGRRVLVKQNMEESETCKVDDQICMVNIVRDSIYDYDKATIDVIVANPYSDEIYVDGSEERRIVLVQLEKLEKEELNSFEIPEDEDLGNKKIDKVFDETVYMATTTSDIEMGPRSYHLEKCTITLKGKDIDIKSDKLILIKKARKGALQIGTRKLILVPQQLKVLACHASPSKVYFVEIKLFNASKQHLRISKRTLIGDVRIEKENFFSETKKIARAFQLPLSLMPFTSKIIMCQVVEGRKCQEGQFAVISTNKHKANHMVIKEGLAAVEINNGISCVPLVISNRGEAEINISDEYDCYTKVRLEKMQGEEAEASKEPDPPGEEKNEDGGSEEIEEITLD